jgi:uncharacterized protein YegP (UPF0339 family)
MRTYRDEVFAPIDYDHILERVGGGNETEVYRSDDGRYVAKLKAEDGHTLAESLIRAQEMRAAAEQFVDCLGPEHSLPSYYLLARDSRGYVQVLVIQPFLYGARPLAHTDYQALCPEERATLARNLTRIISRATGLYRSYGVMPDLYGRSSQSTDERRRLNGAHMLPWRLWGFLVRRTILRSHNLMLADNGRLILVDYDTVRQGPLYRAIYFLVRLLLFVRDSTVIWLTLRA